MNSPKGERPERRLPAKAGDRVGHWTLLVFEGTSRLGQVWSVQCDCGKTKSIALAQLRQQAAVARGDACVCNRAAVRRTETQRSVEERAQRLVRRFGADARLYAGPRVDIDADLPERW